MPIAAFLTEPKTPRECFLFRQKQRENIDALPPIYQQWARGINPVLVVHLPFNQLARLVQQAHKHRLLKDRIAGRNNGP